MSDTAFKIAKNPKLKKILKEAGFTVTAEKKKVGNKMVYKTSILDEKGRGQKKTVTKPIKGYSSSTSSSKFVPKK